MLAVTAALLISCRREAADVILQWARQSELQETFILVSLVHQETSAVGGTAEDLQMSKKRNRRELRALNPIEDNQDQEEIRGIRVIQ